MRRGCLTIQLGISPRHTLILQMLCFGVCLGVMAAGVDWRLAGAALAYLVAFALASLWPDHVLMVMAVANFFAPSLIAWVWRPTTRRRLSPPPGPGSAS